MTKTVNADTITITDLEDAAQSCMDIARETDNIWVAIIAQDCALRIRKLPGWKGRYPDGKSS